MKKLYFRFRILLMTFAFGLASVFMTNGSLEFSDEIFVELPKTNSQSPIIVFSREEKSIPYCEGSAGLKAENYNNCIIVETKSGVPR